METINYSKETKANKQHVCDFCSSPIEKGTVYYRSTHKHCGEIYSWKIHLRCSNIANKLKMWDDSYGEGISTEDFREYIKEEYTNIMSNTQTELYKSRDFKYPNFNDQLLFVIDYHKDR